MAQQKMIPYSVYLPEEFHKKLKELSRERKAASVIREALTVYFGGKDTYRSGYNKAIEDAAKLIWANKEAQMVAINRRDLGDVLSDHILALKIK